MSGEWCVWVEWEWEGEEGGREKGDGLLCLNSSGWAAFTDGSRRHNRGTTAGWGVVVRLPEQGDTNRNRRHKRRKVTQKDRSPSHTGALLTLSLSRLSHSFTPKVA